MTLHRTLSISACAALAAFLSHPAHAQAQTACSPAKVNDSCRIELDRERPVTPLPIRVSSKAGVTIVVKKRPTENVIQEAEFKDIETPDPLTALLTAFLPGLKVFQFPPTTSTGGAAPAAQPGDQPPPPAPITEILAELNRIQDLQKAAADTLALHKKAIDEAAGKLRDLRQHRADTWDGVGFLQARTAVLALLKSPTAAGVQCTSSAVDSALCPLPSVRALDVALEAAIEKFNQNRVGSRPQDIQTAEAAINAIDLNEQAINASLKSLSEAQAALRTAAGILDKLTTPKFDSSDEYAPLTSPGLGRSASVKVSVVDMFTKEKTAVGTVTVNWNGSNWEQSLGVLFGAIPDRSFQAAPVFQGGVLQSDKVLAQTTKRPTVVPMAFGHYRVREDVVGGRRLAWLITGGIGVNPVTTVADFGAGVSLSYRNVVLTPIWHFTRDNRLTNGLHVGQNLGATPPPLTTERYWVQKFAIGISYRLPIN